MRKNIVDTALEAFARGVYKKNIHYVFEKGANPREFAHVKALADSPGMSAWLIQQCQYKAGTQMHVSKQVSDDLMASDFSETSRFEDVPWVSPVVELYFEDPLLPTILLMKSTPEQLQKWFPQIAVDLQAPEYITALMQEGSDMLTGKFLSLQLKPDMYESFLDKGETENMRMGLLSSSLSEQDNFAMAFMLNLAAKVFAFASIPNFKPAAITRKQMKYGGKPDVKGRPQRPAFRVDYLPKVVYAPAHATTEPHQRTFLGRRGFIRWYSAERFVNLKGTWTFIQPVKNPLTGKYPERNLIKVRKPPQ